jgi:hypothetical protein
MAESRSFTPELKRLHTESLKGALLYRMKDDREVRWKGYEQKLAHNWTGGKAKTDSPVVNLTAARTRSIPPRLAFNAPNFEVKAYGVPATPNSEAADAAFLSFMWNIEGFDTVASQVMFDWPAFGLGVGFVGYEKADEGAILDSKRRIGGLAVSEFIDRAGKRVLGAKGDIEAASEQRAVRYLLKHRIFADRVAPLNFAIDPCASCFGEAQHMWRRIFLPYERAQRMFGKKCPPADSVNNVAIYSDSGGADPFGEREDTQLQADLPTSVKRVPVWEGWNITTRETVYLDRHGEFIIGFDWRSPHPDFPFVELLWDVIPDVVYPEGLMAAGDPLNLELNEIRKRELAEASKAFGKYKGPKDISEDAKAELLSGVDGAYVGLDDNDSLDVLQRPSMPAEFWLLEDRIKADFDQVTNTSAYDTGGMPQVRRTATEAAFSQSASDAGMAYRQLDSERWAGRMGERMLAIAHAVFDEPIPLTIANNDESMADEQSGTPVGLGTPIILDYIGTEHDGYNVVTVTSGSMASNAKDLQLSQMSQMATLYGPAPWFKSREFAKLHLSLLTSVKDAGRFIMDDSEMNAPDPNEQMESEEPAASQGAPASEADLVAGMMGGMAPMTGDNGMGGANIAPPADMMGTTGMPPGLPVEGI